MIEIGKALDTGLRRKGKPNQDAIGVFFTEDNSKRPPLLVIADGMGGYHGGEIASKMVVENLSKYYSKANIQTDFQKTLVDGIVIAHNQIRTKAMSAPELSKMGSTVVAAIIQNNLIHLANVGDSRAYLINQNAIKQINMDHSLIEEQVRQGIITPQEALNSPKRNILTMSINAQRNNISPFTAKIRFNPGDTLLLCSDGLWGPVSESVIQAVTLELPPQQAAEKLIQLANTNQGPDNISVIIAQQKQQTNTNHNNNNYALDKTIIASSNNNTNHLSSQ